MRILLLSAYDAASHRYWREGLVKAFPEYDWTVLTLPARYFNWRIRGNSLTWAFSHREVLQQSYDALICTSMVDLSSLRGFVPSLAHLPTLVYCHENQFVYPVSEHGSAMQRIEPQIVSLYTALCADCLVFNSGYNRDSFMQGAAQLLKKMPDHVPDNLLDKLHHAQVLPVPLDEGLWQQPDGISACDDLLSLVWNHRWEYDKGPEQLLNLVKALQAERFPFRLAVLGESFRQQPETFAHLRQFMETHCPDALWHWGYLPDPQDYYRLLSQADIVISTTRHEFQGIAMLEAVALGCVPLAPARLSYPEIFGMEYCYTSTPEQPEKEIDSMLVQLKQRLKQKRDQQLSPPKVVQFGWPALRPRYQQLIQSLIDPNTL